MATPVPRWHHIVDITTFASSSRSRAQTHACAVAAKYVTEQTRALAEAHRQRAERVATANSSLIMEKAQLQRTSMALRKLLLQHGCP